MRTFVRLLSLLAVVSMVSVASAAAPAGVTGIKATEKDGRAVVTWNAVPGGKIAKYRIYYSGVSIIGNDGDYDDYEETKDNKTQWTLQTAPTKGTLYVSVLAVNDKGEESELFTEEAKVVLGGTAAPAVSSSSSSVATSTEPFSVDSIKVVSATGVLVTFSHQVLIYPEDVSSAFRITDASGGTLGIRRFDVKDNTVLVHTVPQVRGAMYTLQATDKVHGTANAPGPQPLLTIDFSADRLTFTGHETGIAPSNNLANSSSAVRNLKIKVTPRTDGTFDVEVTWTSPLAGEPVSYSIYQSRDAGRTYGEPQSVPGGTNAIRIEKVPGGDFGVSVQGVRADGSTTQSVFQSIRLSATGVSSATGGSAVTGNVTTSVSSSSVSSSSSSVSSKTTSKPTTTTVIPPKKTPLTQTGPEALIGVMLTGAGSGVFVSRRKGKKA